MEDMKLPSKQQALNILEESKKYGIAMFPERAQGSAISEIGERLAKERALSRRKYLEEIGETEEDIVNGIENEKPRKASKGKKKASVSASSGTETDSSSRRKPAHKISQQTPKPKPKPKPRGHIKVDDTRADETPRAAVKATVKANKKRSVISSSTDSLIELSSSGDDDVDDPWTFGFRGQRHNEGGSQVYTAERGAPEKDIFCATDDTPKSKSKNKTNVPASEPDDSETTSKPRRKPKPRPVKRSSKQESFVSGENTTPSFPKETEGDRFDWLLDL